MRPFNRPGLRGSAATRTSFATGNRRKACLQGLLTWPAYPRRRCPYREDTFIPKCPWQKDTSRQAPIQDILTQGRLWKVTPSKAFMTKMDVNNAKGHLGHLIKVPPKRVGHALDRFIGTWSAEQEAEILKSVDVFERVDESFWQ